MLYSELNDRSPSSKVNQPVIRAYQPVAVTCKRFLADAPNTSFARGIFLGELREEELFPYPDVLNEEQKETISMMMEAGHSFFQVGVLILSLSYYL